MLLESMAEVQKIGEHRFMVQSDEDKDVWYEVDTAMPWCECKNFYYRKKPCKHIERALKFSQG